MPEFDWDDANVNHIAEHGVEPDEAEQALLDPRRRLIGERVVGSERRFAIVGTTEDGWTIVVVYVHRGSKIRIATARPVTRREMRRWRR